MLRFTRLDAPRRPPPTREVMPWLAGLADDQEPCYLWSPAARRAMERHARSSRQEVAGLLCGRVWTDDRDRALVAIDHAIPATEHVETSGVHVSFRAEAWDSLSSSISALEGGVLLVGWFHTHPGLGAFFSGTDLRTQRGAFREPWQLGLVMDPIRGEVQAFRGPDAIPVDPTRFRSGVIPFLPAIDPAVGPDALALAADVPAPMQSGRTADEGTRPRPTPMHPVDDAPPVRPWWLDPPTPRARLRPPTDPPITRGPLMEAHAAARARREAVPLGSDAFMVACEEIANLEVMIAQLERGLVGTC